MHSWFEQNNVSVADLPQHWENKDVENLPVYWCNKWWNGWPENENGKIFEHWKWLTETEVFFFFCGFKEGKGGGNHKEQNVC